MRGVSKKMFISILTSVIVFVTMVATTFAWVGIFTYANTENFKLNLKTTQLDSNYYLVISSSGQRGTYSDEIPVEELQRQVLSNWGVDDSILTSSTTVSRYFDMKNNLNPCTTNIKENKLDNFKKINLDLSNRFELIDTTKDYIKFDIYLSVNTKEGITSETTGIQSNVYIDEIEKVLSGSVKEYSFYNGNPFLELPSNSRSDVLKSIPTAFKLDNSNAARFALEIYHPISIDEEYVDYEKIYKTIIYQGGTNEPSYNNSNDIYNLGGNLPEDYNAALIELLNIRPGYKAYEGTSARILYENSLQKAIERNDLELIEENKQIWYNDNPFDYLGCMDGVQTKMKISIYLWFEGWDADCLRAIDYTSTSLNLKFTSGFSD